MCGRAEERMSGGAEERRRGGAEERRRGGAEEWIMTSQSNVVIVLLLFCFGLFSKFADHDESIKYVGHSLGPDLTIGKMTSNTH
jgi:hypothetical protein